MIVAIKFSDGWTDLVPLNWLVEDGSFPHRAHECVYEDAADPKSCAIVYCDVDVTSEIATLEYSNKYGDNSDSVSGVMTLELFKSRRIRNIYWQQGDEAGPRKMTWRQFGAGEGGKKISRYNKLLRDSGISRYKKLASIREHGVLCCSACNCTYEQRYGTLESFALFEVHHNEMLSKRILEKPTLLEELSILCANCHQVIHSMPDGTTVENLRDAIAARQASP